jgi:hypothetical protein
LLLELLYIVSELISHQNFHVLLSVSTHLSYPTVIIIPPILLYDIIHLIIYFLYSM